VSGGDVDERSDERRQAEAGALFDILLGQKSRVQHERVVVHPKAGGNREVDPGRLELADVADAKRRVVRHDATLLRP
jgi:hypothetical protein